jgi:hypothetical protein
MQLPRMTIRRWTLVVAFAAITIACGQIGWRWRSYHRLAAWHKAQAASYTARANAFTVAPTSINGDPVAMAVEDGLRQIDMAKSSENTYLGDYPQYPGSVLKVVEIEKAEKKHRKVRAFLDQLLAEDLNRARYHDEMTQKYLEAAARPWLMAPPDRPDPERWAAPNEFLPRKQ